MTAPACGTADGRRGDRRISLVRSRGHVADSPHLVPRLFFAARHPIPRDLAIPPRRGESRRGPRKTHGLAGFCEVAIGIAIAAPIPAPTSAVVANG